MAGYIQEFDSHPNDKIDADLFNNEYGLLNTAFTTTNGHNHAGDAGNGGFVPMISGPNNRNTIAIFEDTNNIAITTDYNGIKITELTIQHGEFKPGSNDTLDLGDYATRFKDLHLAGIANIGTLSVGFTDASIPAIPNELIAITDIFDDDSLTQDSATALCTQQSTKAYIDNSISTSSGIFRQSEYNVRTTTLALSGADTSYVESTLTDIQVGSKVHINATITASMTAIVGTGNILCRVYRDGVDLFNTDYYLVNSMNDSTLSNSISLVDTSPSAGAHTYSIRLRESQCDGIAINGTITVKEEKA